MTKPIPVLIGCICGDASCNVPYGFCHCGCGGMALIPSRTRPYLGYVKGRPLAYMRGHQGRLPRTQPIQPEDQTIRYIGLTHGMVAVVSAHRYDYLTQWDNWCAWKCDDSDIYYARRLSSDGQCILMHREILKPREGFVTDHEDGDGLNNRDSNLREATSQQNSFNQKLRSTNTSGVKGVSWDSQKKKYAVGIRVDGKWKTVARCKSLARATQIRAQVEIEHYGRFRRDTTKK